MDEFKSATLITDGFYFAPLRNLNEMRSSSIARSSLCFSIDDELTYEPFFSDFGPLHLGHTYRFCDVTNKLRRSAADRKISLYFCCNATPEFKANAAVLVGAYLVIFLDKTAEEAYELLKPHEPFPFFRDASVGPPLFHLTVLHCIQGIERAKLSRFIDWHQARPSFSISEYEHYEAVENGDLNWILPGKLLAFGGPSAKKMEFHGYRTLVPEDYHSYFKSKGITTVIRLNKRVYDAKRFKGVGFQHYEMYFPDGSCPEEPVLRRFLDVAEQEKGALAIHCKAGLGRTGVLICSFLIKHYGFSAEEAIGYIRICRPGSVIGPQQTFLQETQAWLYREGERFRKRNGKLSIVSPDGMQSILPSPGRILVDTAAASQGGHGEQVVDGRLGDSIDTGSGVVHAKTMHAWKTYMMATRSSGAAATAAAVMQSQDGGKWTAAAGGAGHRNNLMNAIRAMESMVKIKNNSIAGIRSSSGMEGGGGAEEEAEDGARESGGDEALPSSSSSTTTGWAALRRHVSSGLLTSEVTQSMPVFPPPQTPSSSSHNVAIAGRLPSMNGGLRSASGSASGVASSSSSLSSTPRTASRNPSLTSNQPAQSTSASFLPPPNADPATHSALRRRNYTATPQLKANFLEQASLVRRSASSLPPRNPPPAAAKSNAVGQVRSLETKTTEAVDAMGRRIKTTTVTVTATSEEAAKMAATRVTDALVDSFQKSIDKDKEAGRLGVSNASHASHAAPLSLSSSTMMYKGKSNRIVLDKMGGPHRSMSVQGRAARSTVTTTTEHVQGEARTAGSSLSEPYLIAAAAAQRMAGGNSALALSPTRTSLASSQLGSRVTRPPMLDTRLPSNASLVAHGTNGKGAASPSATVAVFGSPTRSFGGSAPALAPPNSGENSGSSGGSGSPSSSSYAIARGGAGGVSPTSGMQRIVTASGQPRKVPAQLVMAMQQQGAVAGIGERLSPQRSPSTVP